MSKKDYKGVHHNFGGLLMGLGTATAVAGPVNTYLRSGLLSQYLLAAMYAPRVAALMCSRA